MLTRGPMDILIADSSELADARCLREGVLNGLGGFEFFGPLFFWASSGFKISGLMSMGHAVLNHMHCRQAYQRNDIRLCCLNHALEKPFLSGSQVKNIL